MSQGYLLIRMMDEGNESRSMAGLMAQGEYGTGHEYPAGGKVREVLIVGNMDMDMDVG